VAAREFDYERMMEEALRGVVRGALAEAAARGLPGQHHFYVTFRTDQPGAELPPHLKERYPTEMTIVLQYQFWDLKVGADAFEVGLSFGGVPERLTVPFEAITSFVDPSVQFALQFQAVPEDGADAARPPAARDGGDKVERAKPRPRRPARHAAPAAAPPATAASSPASPASLPAPAAASGDKPDKPGAEVVRLDRFRKK
jgi:hypothetical protein